MGGGLPAANTLSLPVRRLLSWFSPAPGGLPITPLTALYYTLRHALSSASPWGAPKGMYEILEYDSTLELKDPRGRIATFRRHQKVKFLQDHIIAFQDHAWGEGEIFAVYKINKGFAADRYQEGDRWNVLISLRETKSKGDIEDFYIERTVKNGFTKEEEWRQVEVWYKTHRLRLITIFPQGRHCRRAVLQTRTDNRTMVLDHRHFQLLPDGRHMLRWETKRPRQAEVYTIRWKW